MVDMRDCRGAGSVIFDKVAEEMLEMFNMLVLGVKEGVFETCEVGVTGGTIAAVFGSGNVAILGTGNEDILGTGKVATLCCCCCCLDTTKSTLDPGWALTDVEETTAAARVDTETKAGFLAIVTVVGVTSMVERGYRGVDFGMVGVWRASSKVGASSSEVKSDESESESESSVDLSPLRGVLSGPVVLSIDESSNRASGYDCATADTSAGDMPLMPFTSGRGPFTSG